jgi:hypothetical protein
MVGCGQVAVGIEAVRNCYQCCRRGRSSGIRLANDRGVQVVCTANPAGHRPSQAMHPPPACQPTLPRHQADSNASASTTFAGVDPTRRVHDKVRGGGPAHTHNNCGSRPACALMATPAAHVPQSFIATNGYRYFYQQYTFLGRGGREGGCHQVQILLPLLGDLTATAHQRSTPPVSPQQPPQHRMPSS